MLNKIILTSAIIFLSIFFITCGSDTPTSNNNTGGTPSGIPIIRLTPGSTYKYNIDSLVNNGGTITTVRTRSVSTDVVQSTSIVAGFTCYPIISTTVDTVTSITQSIDTAYVRYDSTAAKFYQFGISQAINPTQTATWDLVADFSNPRNTEWTIGTINYSITLPPPFGTVTFSGPLKAKVTDSTTQVTSNGSQTYPCYKTVMTASISGLTILGTVSATIILDYYLGFNHPTANSAPGIVRVRLNPFAFFLGTAPVLYFSTVDRILQRATIAP